MNTELKNWVPYYSNYWYCYLKIKRFKEQCFDSEIPDKTIRALTWFSICIYSHPSWRNQKQNLQQKASQVNCNILLHCSTKSVLIRPWPPPAPPLPVLAPLQLRHPPAARTPAAAHCPSRLLCESSDLHSELPWTGRWTRAALKSTYRRKTPSPSVHKHKMR